MFGWKETQGSKGPSGTAERAGAESQALGLLTGSLPVLEPLTSPPISGKVLFILSPKLFL